MEEKNISEKSGAWKNIVIVLLAIAVIGLGIVVIKDRLDKGDSNQTKDVAKDSTKKDDVEKKDGTDKVEPKKIEVDKVKANEKIASLELSLKFALNYEKKGNRLDEVDWFNKDKIVFDQELLNNATKKFDFAFVSALGYIEGNDYKEDYCYNGEEATGCKAFKFDTFKKFYKDLFAEDLEEKSQYDSNEMFEVGVKDNFVYGSTWTGYSSADGIIMKFNSLVLNSDNTYDLLVDVITYNEEDYEKVLDYDNSSVVDGYENLVSYKLQLKLVKVNDDLYTIKSMIPIRK